MMKDRYFVKASVGAVSFGRFFTFFRSALIFSAGMATMISGEDYGRIVIVDQKKHVARESFSTEGDNVNVTGKLKRMMRNGIRDGVPYVIYRPKPKTEADADGDGSRTEEGPDEETDK